MTRDPENAPGVRLAHVSDVHLIADPLGWQWRDWLTKRVSGWLNYRLRRKKAFGSAETVLKALAREWQERTPDRIVFSGDASMLGFETEISRAARLLGVGGTIPGLAVPGNHDYYTARAAGCGAFERCFARWQEGRRVDEATYPFAQQSGGVWLVAVNSARANLLPFDASGRVDEAQLERLARLLDSLVGGTKVLVTHYPVSLADGSPEGFDHGLRNVHAVVDVAVRGGVCLWLHGHRHGSYIVRHSKLAPFPVICAGTATEIGRWSYGEYVIDGARLRGRRRVYSAEEKQFVDGAMFELDLAC
jgi:3',5'-cyclic AMP phosphodiesterase CpdA